MNNMKTKTINSTNGFTMVELMIVVAILTAMMGGLYMTLATGQDTWMNTDTQISLQENIRLTLDRVSKEVRETGSNAGGGMELTMFDGTGVNGSDIIRFAMPVICEAGETIIDANGDVNNWGAPLTWGCTDSTCMDADDDCDTVDYRWVEYRIDNNNQLLRRTLDNAASVVRTDIFAHNISDFQVQYVGAGQEVVRLTVTATRNTNANRTVTEATSIDITLRNRG